MKEYLKFLGVVVLMLILIFIAGKPEINNGILSFHKPLSALLFLILCLLTPLLELIKKK